MARPMKEIRSELVEELDSLVETLEVVGIPDDWLDEHFDHIEKQGPRVRANLRLFVALAYANPRFKEIYGRLDELEIKTDRLEAARLDLAEALVAELIPVTASA